MRIFKEYLKQNGITAVLKANAHSVVICRLIKKSIMQCIYLFTPQEAEIVGNSTQSSSVVNSLGSFFMVPIKVPLVSGFSPSLRMINLKHPYLFAPPGPTNYDKAKYIVPLTFVYSLAPRPLAFHELTTHRGILVLKISSQCF